MVPGLFLFAAFDLGNRVCGLNIAVAQSGQNGIYVRVPTRNIIIAQSRSSIVTFVGSLPFRLHTIPCTPSPLIVRHQKVPGRSENQMSVIRKLTTAHRLHPC